MSQKLSPSLCLDDLKNLPLNQVKVCTIPIGIYLQEAENLHTRLLLDKPSLEAVGLPSDISPILLNRIELLRMAESHWQEHTNQREEVMKAWKEAALVMHAFYRNILDHMAFAFREKPDLLNRLADMKQVRSQAAIIQNLVSLSVLGNAHQQALIAINFDLNLLDQAASMADRNAGLYGKANAYRIGNSEGRKIRDRAYTILKMVVDEVRQYGKFVFRDQPVLVRSYASKYKREQTAQYRSRKKS
ncbi:MAG: hypothetical protein JEZ14_25295 [Marinilabiliaceae bacterium]|nr:hypothetical protein [Marinilabiliaceae bacterium]